MRDKHRILPQEARQVAINHTAQFLLPHSCTKLTIICYFQKLESVTMKDDPVSEPVANLVAPILDEEHVATAGNDTSTSVVPDPIVAVPVSALNPEIGEVALLESNIIVLFFS